MKYLKFLFLLIPLVGWAQTNTEGVITIGRNALYYEDYALSIQYFNQAIQAKPYQWEGYFYRAIAKYYLGDYRGAVTDCNASIERDPFIDECYKLRALNYIMVQKYDSAVYDYKTLLKRQIDTRDIWSNMVLCESQMDSFNVADALLDTMISKWPKYGQCYILKAQIAVQNKDSVKAEILLNKALEIDAHDVDALTAKASLMLQEKRWAEAETTYDKAIFQKPKEENSYLGRAMARYRQKKLSGAMEDYDMALNIDPDNYFGHYNRGLLRMQVGESNLAIQDFDFVLQKEPSDRLALFNRATLLEQTGDFRRAITDYTTVLQQYPNFITGYQMRARCYRAINDNRHAILDERKVTEMQLDEMFGKKKSQQADRLTRKQKDQDIDNYKKMVVEDEEDNIAKFYATDYRGRIQDKEVAPEPQSIFTLTFTKNDNGLSERFNYAPFIERINVKQELRYPLYLSSREVPFEDNQTIQQEDERITQLIKETPYSTPAAWLYFYHAIYLYQDNKADSALQSVSQALQKLPTMEVASFLRAIILYKRAEAIRTSAMAEDVQVQNAQWEQARSMLQTALQDMQVAIQEDEECAFLYYNRACIYAKLDKKEEAYKDYTKAIQLNASLAEAYYNRGLLLIDQGKTDVGIDDLSKAGELGLYSAYSLIKHFRKQENSKKENTLAH